MQMKRSKDANYKEALDRVTERLKEQGYRVIDLQGKSPDAIAIRTAETPGPMPNLTYEFPEIVAICLVGKTHRPRKGWHGSYSAKQKRQTYSMFDRVSVHFFKRDSQYQKGGKPYLVEDPK
jgi:hypothetical protein